MFVSVVLAFVLVFATVFVNLVFATVSGSV